MTPTKSAGAGYTLGVDLGGTNVRVGAYSRQAEKLHAMSFPTRLFDGPLPALNEIAAAVKKVRDQCAEHGDCAGVGIGSPGPIELPAGILSDPANLPGWAGLELKTELEKLVALPVTVDSDANAAALAEWRLGSGRKFQVQSMAMFTLGTGVGGGLILDGKLWHGDKGLAAEPGHTVVVPNGIACNCGSHGCLEKYASASAVSRMARELASQPGWEFLLGMADAQGLIKASVVAQLALSGKAEALAIFEQVGETLGRMLAAWVSTLNLPLYTLGGGMALCWDQFAPAMFRALRDCSQTYRLTAPTNTEVFEAGKTNVLPAQLGAEAGLIGAALLVDQLCFFSKTR
jgi:glucokinase